MRGSTIQKKKKKPSWEEASRNKEWQYLKSIANTKVTNLHLPTSSDQKVLRFDIPMYYFLLINTINQDIR